MTTPAASSTLASQYDPATLEHELYRRWVEGDVFTARAARAVTAGGDRPPFVLIMPPPNVTAVLHMGHGLNNTVQDVLARWRRMAGDETLWVPGTDHAGIATQNVVEKQLARDGLTRFDIGREAFLARTVEFVEETGGAILQQLRAIGASCDWTRTAYTLSPALSVAVREAFVRLHERGLIYRGHRVIHWCPRCLTSLSDEEAEFREEDGQLYHIAYPIAADPERTLTVATTRPETMLGDVAVAVNPDDDRYRDLVGRSVTLPITNLPAVIIADSYADPAFGTGVVKITPAHDANDFEVARRHGLPMPVVIDELARMAEGVDAAGRVPDELRGLDRFAARERIVQMLREAGRLVRTEPHRHGVRHCYRCDTIVEPRLSDQWFVRRAPLAVPALQAVRDGTLRVVPERWEAVYVNWLENIRDWNISRQLWWGHRIPVWYCDPCGEVMVSRTDVLACATCGGAVRQDEDVLDTWFSSWLFPLSTLGWPNEQSEDLRAFYPTDVLVTAPEILFFWVARMVMAGYAFVDRSPFHTVYLTGTVRDPDHVKMSKSLGNGIDPLDVVHLYGADALRYTAVSKLGVGSDLILDPTNLEESFAPGRNFVTKLWHIGRFLLANVGEEGVALVAELPAGSLTRADEWILSRLNVAIADCDAALGPSRPGGATWSRDARWLPSERQVGLRLSEYAEVARRFVWNELADWYLESTKARLATPGADRESARAVLVHVFDAALRLLHPIVPFVTEALWQKLPTWRDGEFLARASWPRPRTAPLPRAAQYELVREVVGAIRLVRAEYAVPPAARIDALVIPPSGDAAARAVVDEERGQIGALARAAVTVSERVPSGVAAHAVLSGGTELVVPLEGVVDVAKECRRLREELGGLDTQLAALRDRLANERFTARAPASVVEGERRREEEGRARRDRLAAKVRTLCGA